MKRVRAARAKLWLGCEDFFVFARLFVLPPLCVRCAFNKNKKLMTRPNIPMLPRMQTRSLYTARPSLGYVGRSVCSACLLFVRSDVLTSIARRPITFIFHQLDRVIIFFILWKRIKMFQRTVPNGLAWRTSCPLSNRSKRGCNGGTPCEQCIRRKQECTYSQRRKSGPRGRPERQQQETSPLSNLIGCTANKSSTCGNKGPAWRAGVKKGNVNAPSRQRFGRRERKARHDESPTTSEESAASPASPARTASINSMSSSSDSSTSLSSGQSSIEEGEQSDSDADVLHAGDGDMLTAEPKEIVAETPEPHETVQAKFTGVKTLVFSSMSRSASPTIAEMPLEPTSHGAEMMAVSNSNDLPDPEGVHLRQTVTTPPLPPASDARPALQQRPKQQQQQPVLGSYNKMELTASWAQPIIHLGAAEPHNGDDIVGGRRPNVYCIPHAIESQPLEIAAQRAPVAVDADKMPFVLKEEPEVGFGCQKQQARAINVSLGSGQAPPLAPSWFDGALFPQPTCFEESRAFGLDVELDECPGFRGMVPSLTREMSLARAVEALGGEQLVQGGTGDVSAVFCPYDMLIDFR